MIRITRLVTIDANRPAGEMFRFDYPDAAALFLWGKDLNQYEVIKDGEVLVPDGRDVESWLGVDNGTRDD